MVEMGASEGCDGRMTEEELVLGCDCLGKRDERWDGGPAAQGVSQLATGLAVTDRELERRGMQPGAAGGAGMPGYKAASQSGDRRLELRQPCYCGSVTSTKQRLP